MWQWPSLTTSHGQANGQPVPKQKIASFTSALLPSALLLSRALYGMEHLFGCLVQVTCWLWRLPSSYTLHSTGKGWVRSREDLSTVQTLFSNSQNTLVASLNHSTLPPVMGSNSIPACGDSASNPHSGTEANTPEDPKIQTPACDCTKQHVGLWQQSWGAEICSLMCNVTSCRQA